MKLLLILCPEERGDAVREVIEAAGVRGFSEIRGVQGAGRSGRHLGSRAFPGSYVMIFSLGTAEESAKLTAALQGVKQRLEPGEGLEIFELDARRVVPARSDR